MVGLVVMTQSSSYCNDGETETFPKKKKTQTLVVELRLRIARPVCPGVRCIDKELSG